MSFLDATVAAKTARVVGTPHSGLDIEERNSG